jgi:hypothetical protein
MTQITIAGIVFTIGDKLSVDQFQMLRNLVLYKNNLEERCMELTSECEGISEHFQSEYTNVIRKYKTELGESKGVIEEMEDETKDLKERVLVVDALKIELENQKGMVRGFIEEAEGNVSVDWGGVTDQTNDRILEIQDSIESILNLTKEINQLQSERKNVYQSIKTSELLEDDPTYTTVREERGEMKRFESILDTLMQKEGEKRQKLESITNKIRDFKSIFTSTDSEEVQLFAKKINEYIDIVLQWKFEIESTIYATSNVPSSSDDV